MWWRLGLDVGTNSIGWAAIGRDEDGRLGTLIDAGVRIFSDGRNPKDNQSLAATRRAPRGMRRNRDRRLKRRDEFMTRLVKHGLMPIDGAERKRLENLDPWRLRIEGLDRKLNAHEFGRALFHLQQRRGFKSNRKTDVGADDGGKIKIASNALLAAMEGAKSRTLAEHVAGPRLRDPAAKHTHPVRVRLHGTGAKAFYDFYPTREVVVGEFDTLWAKQKAFHGDALSDVARDELRDTLIFQRKLKPQPVGRCTLNPEEERAPRALPSVQRLRIYQDINHLTYRHPGQAEQPLSLPQRDALAKRALSQQKLTFDAARKALKLADNVGFNLESERRAYLDGDKTAVVLAAKKRWGPDWRKLDLATQDDIVERLLAEEDEAALVTWLKSEHGLTAEAASAVADARLPAGHGNLGRSAGRAVLAELGRDVVTYDQAVAAAGYGSHSDLDFDGEIFDRGLPYYGQVLTRHVAFGSGEPDDQPEKRYGKLANPSVHVALNQIRRVVNALMQRLGAPAEIVVELARELPLSAKGRAELKTRQKRDQDANTARETVLTKLGQPASHENRFRLRLWEELNSDDPLDRRCPYTGEQIPLTRLFTDEVEIEHILPRSATLDDSPANKTLSVRYANRIKNNRSPYEAFHQSPDGFDWNAIAERAAKLPNNKAWRFAPDAMARYENENHDFLDRQLVDTQYISRLARVYLRRTGADTWVTPGRLTANLRWTWGLDSLLRDHNRIDGEERLRKNRDDHRHHAVDAVVVALTDRNLLQRVARQAALAEETFDRRTLAGLDDPWPGFRDSVRAVLDRMVVSHKPDHGVEGALHNDTAYGIVTPPDKNGRSDLVHRVPLAGLSKSADLVRICDELIRNHLLAATDGLTGKAFTEALVAAGEAMSPPVRKVRIVETLRAIAISDKAGRAYKAYKGDSNYCYDIFVGPKERWTGRVISRFDANQKGFDPKARKSIAGEELIMRLRVNDMLAIGESNARSIMRVVKLSHGKIALAVHFEGGSLKSRDADENDPFSYLTVAPSGLQKLFARLIRVSPAGRVKPPRHLS